MRTCQQAIVSMTTAAFFVLSQGFASACPVEVVRISQVGIQFSVEGLNRSSEAVDLRTLLFSYDTPLGTHRDLEFDASRIVQPRQIFAVRTPTILDPGAKNAAASFTCALHN